MIAIDTNLIVRYLVEDDVRQADRAEAILRSGAVLVPKTVLLEAAWVLRRRYRFHRSAIAVALRQLTGLPGVEVEDATVVAQALEWFGEGLDFADAMHLASSGRAQSFATFDQALRRKAGAISGIVPVIAP